MESQDEQISSQSAHGATNAVSSSRVMAKESGMSQDPRPQHHHMSTCTLQQQQQQSADTVTMNEPNDLSRPASGTLTDLNEGPATKRLKVEDGGSSPSKPTAAPFAKSVHIEGTPNLQGSKGKASTSSSDITPQAAATSVSEAGSSEQSLNAKHGASSSRPGSSVQLNATSNPTKPVDANSSATTSSSTDTAASLKKAPLHSSDGASATKPQPEPPLPIKSLTMMHLHKKYTAELDYMLREFRKLERQLLGAKGNGVEENAGSRERREKLHSFILHLETTLEQIELGVRLEAEGKSTVMVGVTVGETAKTLPSKEEVKQQLADSGALAHLTREKEEEENVQKLEEHILANLLPVKVRLKKQLAAQQGASRNPVGMPVARRGMLPSANADKGTGTFAAAAEQKRKQAEAAAAGECTQFGKPLTGGASSLTQKLHGQTLGSSKRKYGHGVGSSEPTEPVAKRLTPEDDAPPARKILYAGMAPGSKQLKSGVSAASGVHKMVMETPSLYAQSKKAPKATVPDPTPSAPVVKPPSKPTSVLPQQPRATVPKTTATTNHSGQKIVARKASAKSAKPKKPKRHEDPNLTEEERKRLRKLRKRKKRQKIAAKRERERQLHILRQQQSVQAAHAPPKALTGKKGKMAAKIQKKKGPRTVEYICSLCSEVYSSTCACNPWWALTHHECPKCRKSQVPRVDISSPANAIEYHPALLAHAEEGGNNSSAGNGPGVMHINPSHIPSSATFPMNRRYAALPSDSDSDSDLSDISEDGLSDDSLDSDFDELDNLGSMSPAEQAENESFGIDYDGPKLTDEQTSRLLILMSHASTCPGRHRHVKHRDVCSSVKFIMLHVRDCPGTTATYDICPFPWCRKVKHALYHLVSCTHQEECSICSSQELSSNIKGLVGLNEHRRQKQRERRTAAMAAAAAAAKASPPPRAVTKSKAATGPKSAYRASNAKVFTARKAPAHPATASQLKTVPTAPAPASAVAIAAAAAAALPPAKPPQKSSTQPIVNAPAGNSMKAPSVASVPLAAASKVGASVGLPGSTTGASLQKPAASIAPPIKPTVAPTLPNLRTAVASQREAAVAKPVAPSLQSRVVTTSSDATEAQPTVVTPESPAAAPMKSESECRPDPYNKIEDISPDKPAANAPSSLAVPGATGQTVSADEAPVIIIENVAEAEPRHDEDHDESNCIDECCLVSRTAVDKVKTEERPASSESVKLSTTEGKSQTPPSRSPASSCSDEATRKEDAVETISSC